MAWEYPTAAEVQASQVDLADVLNNIKPPEVSIHRPVEKPKQQVKVEEENVVWRPIPNTSQELAISSPAHHTLYCGARGPGKTITQLMRFRSRVGIGYGSYWRGIIFDREFKHLGDLLAQSKRFFPQFEDGAVWHNSAQEYKWVWPTGEELLFRHVKKLEDYDSFHGWEIPFIGWNELTKNPTPDLYDKFMSINRSSFNPEQHTPKRKEGNRYVYDTQTTKPLPPIPLEVFSTTNPSGPGHGWVKERFDQTSFVNRVQIRVFIKRTKDRNLGS